MDLSDFDSVESRCKHCKSNEKFEDHYFVLPDGSAICKSKKQTVNLDDFSYDQYPYFYLDEEREKKEGLHRLDYRCSYCNYRELSKWWERSQHFIQYDGTVYFCRSRV